jgi:hypothetical protein
MYTVESHNKYNALTYVSCRAVFNYCSDADSFFLGVHSESRMSFKTYLKHK